MNKYGVTNKFKEADFERSQPLFLSLIMSQEITISSQLVNQYFGIESFGDDLSYDLLLDRLRSQIRYMLDDDFQGLLNAMYRIDVDERKFSLALEMGKPDEVSRNVAELILDRIILKAKTRIKYSGK